MQAYRQSAKATTLNLGTVGIWSGAIKNAPTELAVEAAQELEHLGFATLWIPGGLDSEVLSRLERLLERTHRINLATGIINIWKHEPADLGAWWKRQGPDYQSRLVLGLGVSHGPLIGAAYQRPLARMREFLDGLEDAGVPCGRLCIAALGPKMLELAAQRTAGAHPYLVSTGHTSFARGILGPAALLAPEQGITLEPDPKRAREIARQTVSFYVRLPNYYNNWRRGGFTDEEITQLSDRFIDSVIAWGGLDAVRARIEGHLESGADHVCLQVITGGMGRDIGLEQPSWRTLASLL